MPGEIRLKSSHLIISPDIVKEILNGISSVYVSYKEDQELLLLSPKENDWFPKLHKSIEFLLKDKDLLGTKSVAIREILIDHDINASDRELQYAINEERRFVKILLKVDS
ncbi:MAG: hypothetical protein RIC06_24470 [Cyclobacteriaceae bacterium]